MSGFIQCTLHPYLVVITTQDPPIVGPTKI